MHGLHLTDSFRITHGTVQTAGKPASSKGVLVPKRPRQVPKQKRKAVDLTSEVNVSEK